MEYQQFATMNGMNVQMEPSWKTRLAAEFKKEYFRELTNRVRQAYTTKTVYPPPRLIFNAFNLCPFESVKVVILGQDPYFNPGQAHGLCFSVQDGVLPPPSLQNIYKEIHDDIGTPIPKSGNLESWAKQGVLLLNTSLSVYAGQPGSHHGWGWEQFTDAAIRQVSHEKEHVVFLLWGRPAREKGKLVDREKHLVLEAAHPSPLSAYKGFFGCKHFSKCNEYLEAHSKTPIVW